MFIQQILSYGNAWERLSDEYQTQLNDIRSAISELTPSSVAAAKPLRDIPRAASEFLAQQYRFDGCWFQMMRELQWGRPPDNRAATGDRRPSLLGLGHVKGAVSLRTVRHRELLNRWLYTIAPLGVRTGVVDIPIALVLTDDAQEALLHRVSPTNAGLFEDTRDELIALSPLSHSSPFLILAVSVQDGDQDIIDLAREEGVAFRQVVVNRSIEFPRQYHQAGLGVLTYFGTVLREKYPNHDAKVRIEQDGLKVRLIIESQNGDREVIEKALQEYELVILGEKPPESLVTSPIAVVELKNELRIAQVRIEGQRDIIALQSQQISTLSQLIGHSLTQPAPSISVDVRPIIQVSSSATQCLELTTSLPEVTDDVRDLLALTTDASLRTRLLDLSEALDLASDRTSAEEIRRSPGVSKLRSFLEDAAKAGTKAHAALEKMESGVALLQGLGRKYNAIAEWCGAPVVPRILLGKDA